MTSMGINVCGAEDTELGERRVSSKRTTESDFHWLRAAIARIVNNERFDLGMTGVILINMIFVVVETDARAVASGLSDEVWIQPMAYIFLSVFILELAARIFVTRMSYFESKLNIMDFCIVSLDIVSQVVNDVWQTQPQLSVLNAFRVCRLLRVIRALSAFRELWLMLNGFASALKAMFWACTLILIVLLIFSVVGVELIRPYNDELIAAGQYDDCEQCVLAFSSVKESFFTMFLMVFIGELWSDLAYPIVRQQPLIGIVFMTAFCIVQLGLLNLILTVIVDGAAQARADDLDEQVEKKKQDCNVAREKLLQLCADMDNDESGELGLDELAAGYQDNVEFASTLNLMDVGADDLEMVFEILDEDKSGTVTFTEFVDQLHKMKTQESHTLLIFIKHHVNEIREKVTQQLSLVRDDLMTKMEDHEQRVAELLAIAKDPNAQQVVRRGQSQCQSRPGPQQQQQQQRSPSFHAALEKLGSRKLHPDRVRCVAPLGDVSLSHADSRLDLKSPNAEATSSVALVLPQSPSSLPVLLGVGQNAKATSAS